MVCQNNAFSKSVSTSVENRFQALIEEASVKKDYEIDELWSSTAMKHIGIFHTEISDAVVSVENTRLLREENTIKQKYLLIDLTICGNNTAYK